MAELNLVGGVGAWGAEHSAGHVLQPGPHGRGRNRVLAQTKHSASANGHHCGSNSTSGGSLLWSKLSVCFLNQEQIPIFLIRVLFKKFSQDLECSWG